MWWRPGWDGKHLRGRHRHVLREVARSGSDDVGANLKWVGDLRTNGNDLAGRFEARRAGRLCSSCVGSMGLHDVREVDPGGTDRNSAHTTTVPTPPEPSVRRGRTSLTNRTGGPDSSSERMTRTRSMVDQQQSRYPLLERPGTIKLKPLAGPGTLRRSTGVVQEAGTAVHGAPAQTSTTSPLSRKAAFWRRAAGELRGSEWGSWP